MRDRYNSGQLRQNLTPQRKEADVKCTQVSDTCIMHSVSGKRMTHSIANGRPASEELARHPARITLVTEPHSQPNTDKLVEERVQAACKRKD